MYYDQFSLVLKIYIVSFITEQLYAYRFLNTMQVHYTLVLNFIYSYYYIDDFYKHF